MPMADPIVIVDAQGNEHEFPAEFDPKRAAEIVRTRTGGSTPAPGPIPVDQQPALPTYGEDVARFLGNEVAGAGRAIGNVIPGLFSLGKGMVTSPIETTKGVLEGVRSIPSEAYRLATEGSQEEIAQTIGGALGTVVAPKVYGAVGRAVPPTLSKVGRAAESAGASMGESPALVRAAAGAVFGPKGSTGAVMAPPILRGTGRLLRRAGDAMGGAPAPSLETSLPQSLTTIAEPRLVGKGGKILPPPAPQTVGWGDLTAPAARQASAGEAIATPPAPLPLDRPDLVPVGGEASFNATRPSPTPALAPSLDELVGRRFDAMEGMRQADAPPRPPLVDVPVSKSHTSGRVDFAPGLTPNDLEALGVDAGGRTDSGVRILKLKQITPEARERILKHRANRHAQYRTDAELLRDLRAQEAKD